MKKYGIYLFYPPMVKLAQEGLGRHLLEFLKSSYDSSSNYQFVIACPSWMRKSLKELLESDGLSISNFEVIGPTKQLALLSIHQFLTNLKFKVKSQKFISLFRRKHDLHNSHNSNFVTSTLKKIKSHIYSIRNPLLALLVSLPIALLSIPFLVLILVPLILLQTLKQGYKLYHIKNTQILTQWFHITKLKQYASLIINTPKQFDFLTSIYRIIEESESQFVLKIINKRNDIQAWYCPTAFWKSFNQIKAPKLMCVPDVVLSDFPVGFSTVGGNRILKSFENTHQAIKTGEFYVTYSEHIKWHTLIKDFQIDAEKVFAIPHGANLLSHLIKVSDKNKGEEESIRSTQTTTLCQNILYNQIYQKTYYFLNQNQSKKIRKQQYYSINKEIKFIFYASQFRPNKNIITLLRAYTYLLKQRYIQHKLILTGNPSPDIQNFITQHNLENDVICLHGLTAQELASCYYLADLAVNPSLSEGGCPFTFTEALSVDTPVVMADIPVTREILCDEQINQYMLFDPYDWKDMAERIEWGLNNRAFLLSQQKPYFDKIAQRTWKHVVEDYVAVLNKISDTHENVVTH